MRLLFCYVKELYFCARLIALTVAESPQQQSFKMLKAAKRPEEALAGL
jgi:hypothetical protein